MLIKTNCSKSTFTGALICLEFSEKVPKDDKPGDDGGHNTDNHTPRTLCAEVHPTEHHGIGEAGAVQKTGESIAVNGIEEKKDNQAREKQTNSTPDGFYDREKEEGG